MFSLRVYVNEGWAEWPYTYDNLYEAQAVAAVLLEDYDEVQILREGGEIMEHVHATA